MRAHLASFVDDFRRNAAETAVVSHRGVRRYRTTYGELAQLAGRFSSELQRRNIGPGERVLLWGENSAAWIAAFFGCLLRGVLVVPLDATGSPKFAARVVDEVSPRLIVVDAELLPSLAANVPMLNFSEFTQALPLEPSFRVDPAVQEDAPFQIIFTSGTTSEPKGIVHTHRNVLASLRPIEVETQKYQRYERWFHPLRFLHTLPLSHVFGQFMGLWIPAMLAAELHLTDALDSTRTIQLIRRERISVLVAVPRILSMLRAHLLASHPSLAGEIGQQSRPSNAVLSIAKRWWRFRAVHRVFGWKFWAIISGGASLPAELEIFWNRLGFALIQGYGMTETAALVTLNHPFHIGRGTIGKPLPGREVRISDSGEVMVRGDVVAQATWQHGGLQRRGTEWLATGDLAQQSESGEFRYLGRKADAIVSSSGLNIHPADLEAAMMRQHGVHACAVVSCDFASGPEAVLVVFFKGNDADLQEAVQNANRELADFQQMRRVLRWPGITFPYTSTGKLLRRTIREWACRAVRDKGAEWPLPEDFLLAAISSISGESVPANASDELRLSEDLHLDSLGRVQLASAIEHRTGVLISDEQIASLSTLADLRRVASVSVSEVEPHEQTGAGDTVMPPFAREETRDAANGAKGQTSSRNPAAVYAHWPWSVPVRLLRSFFLEAILRPLLGILLAPRVISAAMPLNGPFLIVANHVTALDGALVLYALPAPLRRRVAIMMSGEMLAGYRSGKLHGLAGRAAYWLLTALFNVFPLPRLQGFRQSFAHAGEALDRGSSVLIFPEGTRSNTGSMASFRPGIGLLCTLAGVPVLPVALVGLERIRTHGASWFRSKQLEVRLGSPIYWTGSKSAANWTAELEAALRSLLQTF